MHFIKNRKWFYIFSTVIIVTGLISMLIQGFNRGIDFTGGSALRYKIDAAVSAPEVRNTVNDLKVTKEVSVQKSGAEFFIRTNELNQKETAQVTEALKAQYKTAQLLSAESVGPTIGSELTKNAILAISIALGLMLIYISFRFEWTFGLAAVLALFHDILIVLSIFSIFQWEINGAFIAAILTIVGYSINDTIVIFDRVRENLRMKKKEQLDILLDKSIMQTMNRSVNTVVTVLLPLITLLIFGGSTLKGFVMTLLVGFIFGMYSSICIASPLYYEIKQRAS
ncbi:Protein-export membrane protein SecF, bacterial [Syntrophomonas zehnderi OL-4]|uniref:Protein-export membrane protein SecF n=1 Tax=Syntrophomonas zehnderi OL-4 TaxID=690567 RepID=A0A0E4C9C2_9FIRM|nr:protein translocase subunit SecF [Syntrophomonas zehnderi]CFX94411.1 Protein-export membrane protein SecF, bacterial [Syntrophomonas zehnderi OL-4]